MEDKFTPTIKLEKADERGEIYSITLADDQEFLLLHSKKGSLRGGHSHTVDEMVVMLTGSMAYHKRDDIKGTQWQMPLKAGEASFNRAGVAHMGEFLEDSWLIERKLAKKGASADTDWEPWRKRVKLNSQEVTAWLSPKVLL